MAKTTPHTPLERAEIALTAAVEEEPRRATRDRDSPFRILVLGDFSGRESRGVEDPADLGFGRRPVRVDRDTVDDALEQMGVEARLQLLEVGPFITLSMRRLEDFHPDRIFEDVAPLAHLFATRRDLQTTEGFEGAAREVRSWSPSFDGRAQEEAPIVEATGPDMPPSPPGHRISEILDRQSGTPQATAPEGLDAFVRQIVRPHLVPDSSEQEQLLEAVDASVGSWMRNVLHHPQLHALEAAWRGVEFLVRQIESDSAVEVFLLDVTKEELASDLRAVDNLEDSRVWRLLTEEGRRSDEPQAWSLAVGLYRFEPTIEDVALLGRLAKVARATGAPFLGEASPRVLGCDSIAETPSPRSWRRDDPGSEQLWQALRELPESSSIGLALPRFLLRLPYGAETEPLESFRFEEMDGPLDSENLLWGNPALACGALLAQTFERNGSRFRPGAIRDIGGLPLYLSKDSGKARVTPCAEVVLSDSTAEDILERGLIPILSLPDRDVIRVVRFQSIATPARGLAGPWE